MDFQLLINIVGLEHLYEGMVLPRIFKNKIPNICPSVGIVDYRRQQYNIPLAITQDGLLKFHGEAWASFVESFKDDNIKTLCFKSTAEATFQVTAFNDNGLDVRRFPGQDPVIHACLVEVTDESYYKQELPHMFLSIMTKRKTATQNNTARLLGIHEDATVAVHYVSQIDGIDWLEGDEKGVASGFIGLQWTSFARLNNIDNGYWLLFTNHGSTPEHAFNYNVDLFNSRGISIHVEPPHRCSLYEHHHNNKRPHFSKKFQQHATHMLTVPKRFVNRHQLHEYTTATLRFGSLIFMVLLESNDDGQMHIMTDWNSFFNQTGLTATKKLRFELQSAKSVTRQNAYFDIC